MKTASFISTAYYQVDLIRPGHRTPARYDVATPCQYDVASVVDSEVIRDGIIAEPFGRGETATHYTVWDGRLWLPVAIEKGGGSVDLPTYIAATNEIPVSDAFERRKTDPLCGVYDAKLSPGGLTIPRRSTTLASDQISGKITWNNKSISIARYQDAAASRLLLIDDTLYYQSREPRWHVQSKPPAPGQPSVRLSTAAVPFLTDIQEFAFDRRDAAVHWYRQAHGIAECAGQLYGPALGEFRSQMDDVAEALRSQTYNLSFAIAEQLRHFNVDAVLAWHAMTRRASDTNAFYAPGVDHGEAEREIGLIIEALKAPEVPQPFRESCARLARQLSKVQARVSFENRYYAQNMALTEEDEASLRAAVTT